MGQAVPLIIMAVAAGAQAYNTHQTAKKRDQALARGIEKQAKIEQRNAEQAKRFMDELEAGGEAGSGTFQDRYSKQLKLKQAEAMQGLVRHGGQSDAAKSKAAAGESSANEYGGFFAKNFGDIDDENVQRLNEGIKHLGLGTNFSVSGREAQAQDYLARLKAASIQRNPWIDILSSVGMAYAGGMPFGATSAAGGATMNPMISATSGATLPGLANMSVPGNSYGFQNILQGGPGNI